MNRPEIKLVRHFLRRGRRLYLARNGDKHKLLAGPYMKIVRRYPELGHRTRVGRCLLGLDLKLAPQRIDICLLVVHAGELHHMVPDR